MKNYFWSISLLLMLLPGCATQNKANKFYDKHPETFANKCATAFPVKDSITVRDSVSFDTLYLEQEAKILKDSFFVKGDTILRVITKECPPAATLIKTIRHDSTIYRRDLAAEAVLQYQIKDLKKLITDYVNTIQDKNEELRKAENKIENKNRLNFWLIVALVIESLWIFRKPILKLFV